eukprot:gb/GEZN01030964.1/.p1 GENE.gb/GEZN01030964.1/~~gb/GEZN01030964.1/.p1  ORF type:complete len:102 (+),score=5.44 gb/GEZN01030964.1/:77-382(+)
MGNTSGWLWRSKAGPSTSIRSVVEVTEHLDARFAAQKGSGTYWMASSRMASHEQDRVEMLECLRTELRLLRRKLFVFMGSRFCTDIFLLEWVPLVLEHEGQ